MSGVFVAAYRGMCESCDGPVEPGQEARFVQDGIEHVACPQDPAPAQAVCPQCFVELPVTGVCECRE